ncbi:MAG TPA: hypothetical protein VHG08_02545 [Longimicrobium sp.]|nr:hypothetical protein [Longimicrobium sp.]
MSGTEAWRIDPEKDELVVPDVRGGSLRIPHWTAVRERYFASAEMPYVVSIIQMNPEMFGAVRVRD